MSCRLLTARCFGTFDARPHGFAARLVNDLPPEHLASLVGVELQEQPIAARQPGRTIGDGGCAGARGDDVRGADPRCLEAGQRDYQRIADGKRIVVGRAARQLHLDRQPGFLRKGRRPRRGKQQEADKNAARDSYRGGDPPARDAWKQELEPELEDAGAGRERGFGSTRGAAISAVREKVGT